MRLTLRVLLAYLDNILEPADAKTVEEKIAESENVATLVHHIREITKRMRIGAPEVLGKGLGLDPNTVAEYLDYGLSDDGVRDFENVCMTSDVHMAEVAACHEILSLVLVKPAEIDPASRQRMYGLLHEPQPTALRAEPVEPVAASAAAGVAAQRAAAAPRVAPAEPRRKAEVPDYLREPEEAPARSGPNYAVAALILLALALAGGGAALALVPYEKLPAFLQPLSAMIFPSGKPAEVAEGPIPDADGGPTASASGTAAAAAPTGIAVAGTGPAATATVRATSGATADTATAGLRQPGTALAPAATTVTMTSPTAPVPPVPSTSPSVAVTTAASGTSVIAISPAATGPKPTGTVSVTVPYTGTTVDVPANVTAAPAASGKPVKIEPVGRLSSDTAHMLLRYDPTNGWVRVQSRDSVSVGDRLLALPAYRPQVALINGLTLDLLGGTAVELLPLDADGTPGIRILRGRLMVFTVGGPKAKLLVEVGSKQATLSLSTAEASLEHVFRRYVGTDPAAAPLPWALVVTAKSGDVGWSGAPGEALPLKAPGQWVLTDLTALTAIPESGVPTWVTNDEREPLERLAADYVEKALSGGKAVTVALEEVVGDRRSENQQLALRCLAQLGDFDDFMPLLNDATQRLNMWEKYVDSLAAGMDWGAFYADRIRAAMIKQHGPEKGAELYRMLWSYDDEQLRNGAAKYLVETLDHTDLDFRILAYWNLTRITGLSISYAPQEQSLKRRQNMLKWQQKLDAGQIVHKKL